MSLLVVGPMANCPPDVISYEGCRHPHLRHRVFRPRQNSSSRRTRRPPEVGNGKDGPRGRGALFSYLGKARTSVESLLLQPAHSDPLLCLGIVPCPCETTPGHRRTGPSAQQPSRCDQRQGDACTVLQKFLRESGVAKAELAFEKSSGNMMLSSAGRTNIIFCPLIPPGSRTVEDPFFGASRSRHSEPLPESGPTLVVRKNSIQDDLSSIYGLISSGFFG